MRFIVLGLCDIHSIAFKKVFKTLKILSLTDFFMKLFKTNNIEIIKACHEFFGCQLPSAQIAKRTTKFEIQFQERSRLIKL